MYCYSTSYSEQNPHLCRRLEISTTCPSALEPDRYNEAMLRCKLKEVASRPVTTQFSQQNGNTQGPRKQPKPQSGAPRSPLQPSQHNSFPVHDPQPQAEAFPPPQSQPLPHPFPPAQDYYEPHTFPPTQEEQEEAHAFPPTVPQAFPPSQDYYEPHGFSPTLDKADFPPTPNKAHAFPPPHVDPQLYPSQAKPQAFVPQNHNVPAFASSQTQAGTNFPQHG
ncbi:hypothetical protein CQW23_11396 [Capsicum baccatum]|uniref:Uncharacterized protein n=1 Tax=Capsicum baccatum TaxID=33114 RepID=A0A2G2WPL6_CAPBA|nr:hypothetical protein CQW23_11396 [Capsicum baccatum]